MSKSLTQNSSGSFKKKQRKEPRGNYNNPSKSTSGSCSQQSTYKTKQKNKNKNKRVPYNKHHKKFKNKNKHSRKSKSSRHRRKRNKYSHDWLCSNCKFLNYSSSLYCEGCNRSKHRNDNSQIIKILKKSRANYKYTANQQINLKDLTSLSPFHIKQLDDKLQELRQNLKNQHNIHGAHFVFSQAIQQQLSRYAPVTKRQLYSFGGLNKFSINKYGDDIINCIREYIFDNKLRSPFDTSSPVSSNGSSINNINKYDNVSHMITNKNKAVVDLTATNNNNNNNSAPKLITPSQSQTQIQQIQPININANNNNNLEFDQTGFLTDAEWDIAVAKMMDIDTDTTGEAGDKLNQTNVVTDYTISNNNNNNRNNKIRLTAKQKRLFTITIQRKMAKHRLRIYKLKQQEGRIQREKDNITAKIMQLQRQQQTLQ